MQGQGELRVGRPGPSVPLWKYAPWLFNFLIILRWAGKSFLTNLCCWTFVSFFFFFWTFVSLAYLSSFLPQPAECIERTVRLSVSPSQESSNSSLSDGASKSLVAPDRDPDLSPVFKVRPDASGHCSSHSPITPAHPQVYFLVAQLHLVSSSLSHYSSHGYLLLFLRPQQTAMFSGRPSLTFTPRLNPFTLS